MSAENLATVRRVHDDLDVDPDRPRALADLGLAGNEPGRGRG
jgi:hypothetical protein